ncbi:hypothetical protein [Paenibacillus hexagrammi]|uniref:Methyl-accepting chemotaxis protein n=1 Tax=Paenibacillus hexagrammi TaxID=2908839 RepID=A0ABY3SDG2_9BACL|nr:hypothetical protein [Paenibacillus sp. YPD9-1]UJF31191.1 hypothetical protein L0M14_14980 [Paenibacillus sp. YPD9-1]
MTSSRNHQGAHGIGQIEKQLNQQAQAAELIQGACEADQHILAAANQQGSSLDDIIEVQNT